MSKTLSSWRSSLSGSKSISSIEPDSELRQDDRVFDKVEIDELINEILSLPETYRYPLYLYGVYDYKITEIANLLGITTETAKKRVQRARKILKDNLEKGR